jgi:hypothetical protein
MFILKSFKSFVLKLRIPKGLGVCFAEVRILQDLGGKQLKVESLKLNGERFGELNTETQSSENGGGIRDRDGAEARADFNAPTGSGQARCKEFVEKDGYTPPRVFFVRVANTGLMVDAASRIATKGYRGTVASVE